MPPISRPAAGSCRCGEVRLRIGAQPILTTICHCRGCQKMSASAFSLSVAVPSQGFEITGGTPVLGGMRNPQLQHFFCPSCMSWMFTRFMPEFVNIRVTMLDDTSWFVPFVETWTRTRLSWVTTPAVHRYPEFPDMSEFAQLLGEFSRWTPDPRQH
jgi:hypothetical protein